MDKNGLIGWEGDRRVMGVKDTQYQLNCTRSLNICVARGTEQYNVYLISGCGSFSLSFLISSSHACLLVLSVL